MLHEILLPVADVVVSPWLIIVLGFVGGILTGLLGVGSGLFVTPTLMTLGVPPLIAVASQVNSMIGISLTAYLAYHKNNDVDYQLGRILITGGFVGTILGVICLEWLGKSGDQMITLSYAAIISIMAFLLFQQSQKHLKRMTTSEPEQKPTSPNWITALPFVRYFPRSRLNISVLVLLFASLVNGWFIAVLGVGNGVFMMPILIYFMGRTSPVSYGTALLSSVILTIMSTFVHALSKDLVDLILVALLLVGGLLGGHIGVKYSYKIPRVYLGIGGAGIMILMLVQMGLKILVPDLLVLPVANLSAVSPPPPYLWIRQLGASSPLPYALIGIGLSILLSYIFQFLKILARLLFTQIKKYSTIFVS